jgi:sigma-B regulation protein RsbU (phosphoserine phosphatase)
MRIKTMFDETKSTKVTNDDELSKLRLRVSKLSSLIEVSIIINSTLDLDELVNLVMEKAQFVMHAEASVVMLVNEESGFLECQVALGEVGQQVQETIKLKIGEGIAGWVAQTGEPLIVPDVQKDTRFANRVDKQTGFVTRSILAVPLMVKDKVIGVAEVINRLDGEAFDEENLDLFSTFGRQVALAIENAKMHKLMLERQKFEQQLEAARIIQESFLPQRAPADQRNRFRAAGKSIAASSIGGDFFDYIEFDENTLGMVMGDVAGKGIPAALYMARLVSDFRFQTQIERDPAQILATINNLLVERGRRGMFVTLQYLLLDTPTGTVKLANAGHLPMLNIKNHGKECRVVNGQISAPLGILKNMEFSCQSIDLDPGDILVCFTDGIIEAKNKKGKQYTLENLTNFLRQDWVSPDQIVESLIESVNEFARGVAQHDDLTVTALQWVSG